MEQPKRKNNSCLFSTILMLIIVLVVVMSGNHTESGPSNSYVKPYHTRSGRLVKAHTRKSVSVSPNAVKRQNYSKGYYQRHKSRYNKTKKD